VSPVWKPRNSTRPSLPPAAAGGFTLVEMLVVLVIVGLVSAVLLSGFERVLDIRLRLAAFLDGTEAPVLVADWFRATVGGIVAAPAGSPGRLIGAPRHLSALSLAALDGTAGVPTPIDWELRFNDDSGRSELRYRDGGGDWMLIASWPGDTGGFSYCGPDLVCHAAWPPDKQAAQLPALVRLDAVKGSEDWPILAAPQSSSPALSTGAVAEAEPR